MCVIAICEKRKPSKKDLQKMNISNPDGFGIAWNENGKINFIKGLFDFNQIKKLVYSCKLPFTIHFRLASVSVVSNELCHPFPIDKKASLDLEGKASKVLFHNGHYADWQKTMLTAITTRKISLPGGPWTDTRSFAFLSAIFGLGYLDLIDEKIVVMDGKKDVITYYGAGWIREKGIVYSNKYWNWNHSSAYYGYGYGNDYIFDEENKNFNQKLLK